MFIYYFILQSLSLQELTCQHCHAADLALITDCVLLVNLITSLLINMTIVKKHCILIF